MEWSIYSFEFWNCILSTLCTTLISLYLIFDFCIQWLKLPPRETPFLSHIFVPYVLSSGMKVLLDLNKDPHGQEIYSFIYIMLIFCFVIFHLLGLLTSRLRIKVPVNWWLFKFFYLNFFTKEGAYKNVVRFFYTFGTFCGLAGLLIGIFSLLTDLDFVLEFESKGALKNLTIRLKYFEKRTQNVADIENDH